jgi:CBS domain containing-hemolysin-like protein
MHIVAIIVILILIFLPSSVLFKAFNYSSVSQLRHQARKGDAVAKVLYQAGSYGMGLIIVLWIVLALLVALLVATVALTDSFWLVFLVTFALIWLILMLILVRKISKIGLWMTGKTSPLLMWAISYTHPFFDKINWLKKRTSGVRDSTTVVFEKEDLLHLLRKERRHHEGNIDEFELLMLENIMLAQELTAGDIMLPIEDVRSLNINDVVGPLLLDELYKSKRSKFPVVDDEGGALGVVYIRDLLKIKEGSRLEEVLHSDYISVSDETKMIDVIKMIAENHDQVVLVQNYNGELLGFIGTEDILANLLIDRD